MEREVKREFVRRQLWNIKNAPNLKFVKKHYDEIYKKYCLHNYRLLAALASEDFDYHEAQKNIASIESLISIATIREMGQAVKNHI